MACGVDPRASACAATRSRSRRRPAAVDPLDGIVPASAPVVLYVGRIAAEKGVEHLLEAARRLPDVHVVLAGPDDRHGTMAAVQRSARRSRVPRAGSTCCRPRPGRRSTSTAGPTCFVLASGGENFGLVAAEAAAVGTPVIVSDRTGVAASFGDGEALVVPYDPEATVAAIDRVARRRRAAAASLRRARSARRAGRPGTRSSTSRSRSTARRSEPDGRQRGARPGRGSRCSARSPSRA